MPINTDWMEVEEVMLFSLDVVTLLPSIQQNDWAVLIMYLSLLSISFSTCWSAVRQQIKPVPQCPAKARSRFSLAPKHTKPTGAGSVFGVRAAAAQEPISCGWVLKLDVLWPSVVAGSQACTLGKIPIHRAIVKSKHCGGKITLRLELDNVVQVHGPVPLMMLFKTLFSHYPLWAELQSSPLKITAVTWINWLENISSLSHVPQQNLRKPRKMLAQIWKKFCLEAWSLHVAVQTNTHIRGSVVTALGFTGKEARPAAGLKNSCLPDSDLFDSLHNKVTICLTLPD